MSIINSDEGMKKSELPQASEREDGIDLISNMPDAILLLILSSLSSTEEQIRTSILSRRWRYLWTAIHCVNIRFVSEKKLKQSEFEGFVDWVLASKSVNLDCFHLCLDDYDDNMSTVWRWVHVVVTRNVKHISLKFAYKETEAIEFPDFLVSCGSLKMLRLDLNNRNLSLPSFVGFPALRLLILTYGDLLEGEDLVNDFLKSFPLLEDLILLECIIAVDIVCPKLQRLTLVNWDDIVSHDIKIFGPDLVYLDIGGCLGESDSDPMWGNGNFHFKWAHLYFYCEGIALGPALPNLKTLFLRTTMEAFTVDELIRFLKCCPKLEKLTLVIRKDCDEEYELVDDAETRRIWTAELIRVELFEFNGEKPKLELWRRCFIFSWERGRACGLSLPRIAQPFG